MLFCLFISSQDYENERSDNHRCASAEALIAQNLFKMLNHRQHKEHVCLRGGQNEKRESRKSRVNIQRPLRGIGDCFLICVAVGCAPGVGGAHRPAGSAPYGRTSVPVRLRRTREGAESPSRSAATTWLRLQTPEFHV